MNGEIITFYSYKGGVGRSMALANCAWELAKNRGKKICLIDWDIEAPGLHNFFRNRRKITSKPGLIDFFHDYLDSFSTQDQLIQNERFQKKIKRTAKTYEEFRASIEAHRKELKISKDDAKNQAIRSLEFQNIQKFNSGGAIHMLHSGRLSKRAEYNDRVNRMDWGILYDQFDGYDLIERFKERIKSEFDLILIDSRTGVTDIGGICTLQMPDKVVIMFTLNEQNIEGTRKIIDSINSNSNDSPKIILQPSRFDVSEAKLTQRWKRKAIRVIGKDIQRDLEIIDENKLDAIFEELAIPYIPYYNFGESIAIEDEINSNIVVKHRNLVQRILGEGVFFSSVDMTLPTANITTPNHSAKKKIRLGADLMFFNNWLKAFGIITSLGCIIMIQNLLFPLLDLEVNNFKNTFLVLVNIFTGWILFPNYFLRFDFRDPSYLGFKSLVSVFLLLSPVFVSMDIEIWKYQYALIAIRMTMERNERLSEEDIRGFFFLILSFAQYIMIIVLFIHPDPSEVILLLGYALFGIDIYLLFKVVNTEYQFTPEE